MCVVDSKLTLTRSEIRCKTSPGAASSKQNGDYEAELGRHMGQLTSTYVLIGDKTRGLYNLFFVERERESEPAALSFSSRRAENPDSEILFREIECVGFESSPL